MIKNHVMDHIAPAQVKPSTVALSSDRGLRAARRRSEAGAENVKPHFRIYSVCCD